MAKPTRTVDLEPIDRLEEKVKLLVAALERLKNDQARSADERERLLRENEMLKARLGDAANAGSEIAALKAERDQIRSRVAGMLERLEGISL